MEWDEAQRSRWICCPSSPRSALPAFRSRSATAAPAMTAVDYCICIEELARVDPSIALSVAAHNGLCSAHINMFGSDAQRERWLAPAGAGRDARRVGADRGGRRAATPPACARPPCVRGSAGSQRHRRASARTARIGGVMVVMACDRSRQGSSRRVRVRRPHGHARACRAGKKENKLGMRASDTSEVIFQDCRVPWTTCSARKARASSTRCRCSTPAGSGSPRSRSGSRRARTKRRATTRASGGSSASRSRRSRPSSGSSPITRPRSKRRGC